MKTTNGTPVTRRMSAYAAATVPVAAASEISVRRDMLPTVPPR
jgi:hypothetical protein